MSTQVNHRPSLRCSTVQSAARAAVLAALVGVLLLITPGPEALAQTSGQFDLTWHTVTNGGGTSSSANFRVNGTIGQAAAGPPAATSANFVVTGGYWTAELRTRIFLPLVVRA